MSQCCGCAGQYVMHFIHIITIPVLYYFLYLLLFRLCYSVLHPTVTSLTGLRSHLEHNQPRLDNMFRADSISVGAVWLPVALPALGDQLPSRQSRQTHSVVMDQCQQDDHLSPVANPPVRQLFLHRAAR